MAPVMTRREQEADKLRREAQPNGVEWHQLLQSERESWLLKLDDHLRHNFALRREVEQGVQPVDRATALKRATAVWGNDA